MNRRGFFQSVIAAVITAALPTKAVVPVVVHHSSCFVCETTTLTLAEWVTLDTVVLQAARMKLRAWVDLELAKPIKGWNNYGI